MRILAVGGRNFTSMWMNQVLDNVHMKTPVTEVFHTGEPAGASYWVACWALGNGIKETGVRPQWSKHGKSAAKIRNVELMDMKPDLVVVFPGGYRTRALLNLAQEKKLDILVPLKTNKLGFYNA